MKKIDFSNLRFEERIGEYVYIDIRKELGNAVFANASTLEADSLARRIHGAPAGAMELADDDYSIIMQALQAAGAKYAIIRALNEAAASEASEEAPAVQS